MSHAIRLFRGCKYLNSQQDASPFFTTEFKTSLSQGCMQQEADNNSLSASSYFRPYVLARGRQAVRSLPHHRRVESVIRAHSLLKQNLYEMRLLLPPGTLLGFIQGRLTPCLWRNAIILTKQSRKLMCQEVKKIPVLTKFYFFILRHILGFFQTMPSTIQPSVGFYTYPL